MKTEREKLIEKCTNASPGMTWAELRALLDEMADALSQTDTQQDMPCLGCDSLSCDDCRRREVNEAVQQGSAEAVYLMRPKNMSPMWWEISRNQYEHGDDEEVARRVLYTHPAPTDPAVQRDAGRWRAVASKFGVTSPESPHLRHYNDHAAAFVDAAQAKVE